MLLSRWLKAVAALLGLTVAVTCTQVWGDATGARPAAERPLGRADVPADVPTGKFSHAAVVTYKTTAGETIFALQVKPKLPAAITGPRDVLVMVDTSASQAGQALDTARKLVGELASSLRGDDRISVWTVNTPAYTRDLTKGFRPASTEAVQTALTTLYDKEYASGATDLKAGLTQALSSFDGRAGRQQVIVFLGDGESAAAPLAESDRRDLAEQMVARQVLFVPVPLGPTTNPQNLHGLASGTGGALVRIPASERPAQTAARIITTLNVPVLYPTRFELNQQVIEHFPTKLPPLRADAPTLVVGRCKEVPATLDYRIAGTVNGQPMNVGQREAVPGSEFDHYFLVSILDQWQQASAKATPALVRADRALALAYEQNRLVREEFLTQAHWALRDDQLDAAARCFESVKQLDPHDNEAATGLKVVDQLRKKLITREQLKAELDKDSTVLAIAKTPNGGVQAVRSQLSKLAQAGEAQPAATPGSPAVTTEPDQLLKEEARRRGVLDQQAQQNVENDIKRARSILAGDPDGATDLLKRAQNSVRDNAELTDRVRAALLSRLESVLRDVALSASRIRQTLDADRERQRRLEERDILTKRALSQEETIRERIRSFTSLMNQARFEEAYREALVMQQDAVSKGQPVPVEAAAAYTMSINATNLREVQELNRINQERFLVTMLQVDKSHVPYPDEPPVHFPPATVWRQLTDARRGKYDASGLGRDASPRTLKLRDQLNRPITLEREYEGNPLKEILNLLANNYDVTFLIDTDAFKAEGAAMNIEEAPVKLPKMTGVSLGTALRILLSQLTPAGTYLIRRDYIEITTGQRALSDKVVRAYPVADLVIPVPSSINQQVLNQNLSVLGQTFSINGQQGFLNQVPGQGGAGALGALGALGVAGALGALGNIGAGAPGGGGGGAGPLGQPQGQQNLGAGGGFTGFGGGALGQFGNLGGQFGFQGGTQHQLLIDLITSTIAKGEWTTAPGVIGGGAALAGGGMEMSPDALILQPDQLNSLGYYPPAQALVVRGTSRIHTSLSGLLPRKSGAPAAAMGPGSERDRAFVIAPGGQNNLPAAGAVAKDPVKDGKEALAAIAKTKRTVDAKKDWHAALAKGGVDPGMLIACVDFLGKFREFDHAAELLKANLRTGGVAQPWMHEALAVALQAGGAAAEEVERARMSAIDLEPKNPQAYLRVSKHLDEAGQTARALVLCQRAAALEPNLADAYSDTLVYADHLAAKGGRIDAEVVQWAATNLLKGDWAGETANLHAQAKANLAKLQQKLIAANRGADATKLQAAVAAVQVRDLVFELSWQGSADLDLKVTEPIGSVASTLQRHTPGGGVMRADDFTTPTESYTAVEAFTGTYVVKADVIWGKALGNKATLKVIKHQGTPQQQQEIHTLELTTTPTVKVQLDAGRRTVVSSIRTPTRTATAAKAIDSDADVMHKLRSLADPIYATSVAAKGMHAGVSSVKSRFDAPAATGVTDLSLQSGVTFGGTAGLDLVVKTVVNKDGQTGLSLTPAFTTNERVERPTINLSLIPGSR